MKLLKKRWKMWENIEILNLSQKRGRSYLVSETNYHTTKFFTEHLLTKEMKENRNNYE